MTNLTTLCYLEQDGAYLMLHRVKKEKDVNRDKWIGVGGHFEEGESPEECMRREVLEETGYQVEESALRGIVTFCSDVCPCEYMFLFTVSRFSGTEKPCDEGDLRWVPKAQISALHLWEGDKIFLRLLAEEAPFFSLKLTYRGDTLVSAALDGAPMPLGE